MAYENIVYEKDGNLARITFNRPDKLNTLNVYGKPGVMTDTLAALQEAAEDDDVKVVVVKGRGTCFSAGEDLGQVVWVYGFGTGKPGERRPSQRVRLSWDHKFLEMFTQVLYSPKVTVGQGHGYCFGAASLFLLFCDIAIVAEDAVLGFPDNRIGTAGTASPYIIPLILSVGLKRARELVLTGRTLSGKEAAEIGLVARAVPADRLEQEVESTAQAVALLPRDGLAISKAAWRLYCDILGVTAGVTAGELTHTLFTNLRWEADEYNFVKERRDEGLRPALHGMHKRYSGLTTTPKPRQEKPRAGSPRGKKGG